MEEFKVTALRPHIIQLENSIGNCCTLITGRERAILFDTMSGYGDLRDCVESLTDLPVIVVNSHGHFDHMGGNYQFNDIYMSPLDRPLLPQFERWLGTISRNAKVDLSPARASYHQSSFPLKEGMQWDLGGITVRAIALPGHTAGSMGLLLEEDRILLAGDGISPEMCLFFPESLPVSTYVQTLQKVMNMDIDWFVQGHYSRLFPKSLVEKLLNCAMLPGKKKGCLYTNSLIPELHGCMYIFEFRNRDVGGTICIITKEERYVSDRLG